MSDNTVLKLSQPSTFSDPLTEVLRSGARSLLARAVEAEVAAFLDGHSEARTEEGRRRLVRHGHLPEREIMTGIGPVAVRAPRVRDRTDQGADRIRFSSALLPPYARRSKSLEVLIPVLYLKGISTGDFAEALAALLGPDAGGLSASTVARLTEVWADEHAHWLKRDLSARHYVYFIHVQARLEDDAQCLLVIIGATPEGKKELVGLIDGVRESAQSWLDLRTVVTRHPARVSCGTSSSPELRTISATRPWSAPRCFWTPIHDRDVLAARHARLQHRRLEAGAPRQLHRMDPAEAAKRTSPSKVDNPRSPGSCPGWHDPRITARTSSPSSAAAMPEDLGRALHTTTRPCSSRPSSRIAALRCGAVLQGLRAGPVHWNNPGPRAL